MTPLRDRILCALRLQPMTVRELARCLSASRGYIENLLERMRVNQSVRHVGCVRNGKSKPQYLWGAA